MKEKKNLVCGILCGGQSHRMGRSKARLLWQGEELVDVLAARLAPLGSVLLSVRDPAQLQDKPYARCVDRFPGALGGLYSALAACDAELLFVTACDMPFVTAETVRVLLSAMTEEVEAVVPVDQERRHPLCALYRRSVCGIALQQLQAGELRLQRLLDRLRVREVPADKLPDGARTLWNLNTPEAYAQALEAE